jgi:hypothetical protein
MRQYKPLLWWTEQFSRADFSHYLLVRRRRRRRRRRRIA